MGDQHESRRSGVRTVGRQFVGLVRGNLRLVVVTVCILVFVGLLENVLAGDLMRLDLAAYWLVVQRMRSAWLTPVMEGFSALASPVTLVVLLLVVAAFAPGRRPGRCCAVNLVLVVLINQGFKYLVQRPRPDGFRLATVSGSSFPSGHSMVAMAFFGLLVWFVWHYERDVHARHWFAAAFVLIIVMVGVSRIYLGVHYASDVVGGFCLSLAWLALYTRIAVPLFMGERDMDLAGSKQGPRRR